MLIYGIKNEEISLFDIRVPGNHTKERLDVVQPFAQNKKLQKHLMVALPNIPHMFQLPINNIHDYYLNYQSCLFIITIENRIYLKFIHDWYYFVF